MEYVRRPIRIGNISGATGDHPLALSRMINLPTPPVDIITGDFLSEMNIAWRSIDMNSDPPLPGYEIGFLHQLQQEGVIEGIAEKRIKVVVNAGAMDTRALGEAVVKVIMERGLKAKLKVAVVVGDNVTEDVRSWLRRTPDFADRLPDPSLPRPFYHLDDSTLALSSFEPLRMHPASDSATQVSAAVAYIGSSGIAAALEDGCDIVLCGRVTDASPVIGAAAWWFGWKLEQGEARYFDKMAGALVAGHLIECGPYITGANFSGFKELLDQGLLVDLSFPIAEISEEGSVIITKCPTASQQTTGGGRVTKDNTICQLLYEIQGEIYLNPDVTADLKEIRIVEVAENRILVSGVKGLPPPSTTKAMVAAFGGYQAEATFYINGLDIREKAEMMKSQLRHAFEGEKFSKFSVELYGVMADDPRTQQEGTVMLRVFVQARRREDLTRFKVVVYALRMQSYPGYHMNLDFRTMDPKPFMEIFPIIFPLDHVIQQVIIGDKCIDVPSVCEFTKDHPIARPSYETENPVELSSFGPTTLAPLGYIVHARSGDKANNSNVGFFVRHTDEWDWLRSFLTVERLIALLGDDHNPASRIERCEFPGILAVHFRIMDFLDGGIASSSRIDGLGKGVGEFLRSRKVDLPKVFLDRGRI